MQRGHNFTCARAGDGPGQATRAGLGQSAANHGLTEIRIQLFFSLQSFALGGAQGGKTGLPVSTGQPPGHPCVGRLGEGGRIGAQPRTQLKLSKSEMTKFLAMILTAMFAVASVNAVAQDKKKDDKKRDEKKK